MNFFNQKSLITFPYVSFCHEIFSVNPVFLAGSNKEAEALRKYFLLRVNPTFPMQNRSKDAIEQSEAKLEEYLHPRESNSPEK